ncbi:hypothetical protein J6590_064876 [Homalodisca vitripennis]|nr:hypothetical protein J6590_064876 [Homalodisca vitripennis]
MFKICFADSAWRPGTRRQRSYKSVSNSGGARLQTRRPPESAPTGSTLSVMLCLARTCLFTRQLNWVGTAAQDRLMVYSSPPVITGPLSVDLWPVCSTDIITFTGLRMTGTCCGLEHNGGSFGS